jgi:hypothetical protein
MKRFSLAFKELIFLWIRSDYILFDRIESDVV